MKSVFIVVLNGISYILWLLSDLFESSIYPYPDDPDLGNIINIGVIRLVLLISFLGFLFSFLSLSFALYNFQKFSSFNWKTKFLALIFSSVIAISLCSFQFTVSLNVYHPEAVTCFKNWKWKTTKHIDRAITNFNTQANLYSANFSPDGQHLVTASTDGVTHIWDLSSQQLATLKSHESGVTDAKFSPDGQHIITVSRDGTARIWDWSGRQLAILQGHQNIFGANFSPNGKYILTRFQGRTAKIWDLLGQQLAVFQGHKGVVTNASFSPDGRYILTTSKDKTVRVWDLSAKQLAIQCSLDAAASAIFSPNGQQIVTVYSWNSWNNREEIERTARLWNWNELVKKLVILEGHKSYVISANFSPDGQKIITASYDGTARLWDISDL
jgi:WD40 repeat protein